MQASTIQQVIRVLESGDTREIPCTRTRARVEHLNKLKNNARATLRLYAGTISGIPRASTPVAFLARARKYLHGHTGDYIYTAMLDLYALSRYTRELEIDTVDSIEYDTDYARIGVAYYAPDC